MICLYILVFLGVLTHAILYQIESSMIIFTVTFALFILIEVWVVGAILIVRLNKTNRVVLEKARNRIIITAVAIFFSFAFRLVIIILNFEKSGEFSYWKQEAQIHNYARWPIFLVFYFFFAEFLPLLAFQFTLVSAYRQL